MMNSRTYLFLIGVVTVLVGCTTAVGSTIGCSFTNSMNQWTTVSNCVNADATDLSKIQPEILMQLEFDPTNDLAPILLAEGWVYIDRTGTIVIRNVPGYDNGPEPFKDGLLRVQIDGKFGFVDSKGISIIPAQYDGAFAFDGGYTSVCTGCTVESTGDYHEFYGGKWLCINTKGEMVAEKLCESE